MNLAETRQSAPLSSSLPAGSPARAEDIPEAVLREFVARAMQEVFKTSLGLAVSDRAPADGRALALPVILGAQVVGSVGFFGTANGAVYLCFEESCARLCAATMLGLTESEATEMGEESVHDAIGELTNMVAGAFKNGLCDSGFPCKLTIPSILRGRDVCVEPTSTVRRHAYAFETQRQEIVADILMKSGA